MRDVNDTLGQQSWAQLVTHMPALRLVVLHSRDSAQILLSGELDHFSARSLAAAVAEITADPRIRSVRLDAALVEFCDAGGIAALLQTRQRAAERGVRVRMVRSSPAVRRIVELIGLERHRPPTRHPLDR